MSVEITEILGPPCKNCGHHGGGHRKATVIGDQTFPACPGPAYDPADVAIYQTANPDDTTQYPT